MTVARKNFSLTIKNLSSNLSVVVPTERSTNYPGGIMTLDIPEVVNFELPAR